MVRQVTGNLVAGDVLVLTVDSRIGLASATIVWGGASGSGTPVGASLSAVGVTTYEVPATDTLFVGVKGAFAGNSDLDATLTCRHPASTATATAIPDWVQGYARAGAEEACRAGWNPSWARWPNAGTGGFTCGRSLPSLG